MDYDYQNIDVIAFIEKHINQLVMDYDYQNIDVIAFIEKHINQLKPWFPSQTLISIGEYPLQILLKGNFLDNMGDILPIFISKSSRDIIKWGQSNLEPYNILGLDTKLDTHLWFQVYPNIIKNDDFGTRLKTKPLDNVNQAIIVSSIWDGIGSALLPIISSELREFKINSVAFAILPSRVQPPDVHFNAFSSLGLSISTGFTPLLLINRDNLEHYVGINRKGTVIKGNALVNYLIELLLTKGKFVGELTELSRSFDAKIFTVLLTTGASIRIYGSLENILNASLLRPLSTFNLSTASLLYVLLRIPSNLKIKLPREQIEFSIANWVKDKASLKSIYFSEPIYTEDSNDRIDIVMFIGGLDLTGNFSVMEKNIDIIKNDAINRGLMNEQEWKVIVNSLIGN
jgi:hypothetical protein